MAPAPPDEDPEEEPGDEAPPGEGAPAQEEEEAAAAEEQEEVSPTFVAAIGRRGAHLLPFFSLVGAVPLFRASPRVRTLLSGCMSCELSFVICSTHNPVLGEELNEIRRRCKLARTRLPREPARGPVRAYVLVSLREAGPVRRAYLNRCLTRVMPFVKWESVLDMHISTRGELGGLDPQLYTNVGTMDSLDAPAFLQEAAAFRHLSRLSLTLPQILALGRHTVLPQVTKLKLLCRDANFVRDTLDRVPIMFPALEQMHLALCPTAFLQFCGPYFVAPPDLRLSLEESPTSAKEANVFVASHLLTLPFSWESRFLTRVVRLQMEELNENYAGLTINSLASIVKMLPNLRRLGTVSLKAFFLMGIPQNGTNLEELVLVMDVEDMPRFFRHLVPIEQNNQRSTIRRFAIHLLARDGCSRLSLEIENAICAGWCSVAASFLHREGFIVFSMASETIMETAVAQLPWFDQLRFNLDAAQYRGGRLPRSTPVTRPISFLSKENMSQPQGTLVVCRSLRPSGPLDDEEDDPSRTLRSTAAQGALAAEEPPAPAAKKPPPWLRMSLVDCVEALMKLDGDIS